VRGLTTQFLAPVAVLLLGTGIGWYFYEAAWGLAAGSAAAMLCAVLLGSRMRRRLRDARSLASGQTADIDFDSINAFDDVGETVRAISERVSALRRQRDAAELQLVQQAQVLDRMNDGLMRVDEDHTVVFANVAAGTLFGGRNPTGRSFVGVTRDHELDAVLRRCLESGVEQEHTFEIAGEGRLLSAVMIRITDRPPEALVMLRDITEVNRLQNLRRDFVSNVSHELRTPLSTIKILTETLIDMRETDTEAVQYLTKIDGEVDSMTALVRDLLDLTRLEASSARLAARSLSALQLVQDVRERMRPLAERHQVELLAVADDGVSFDADERRLHQALVNLVTNAINHTPAGGRVTVEARADDDVVHLLVSDTGSGIDERDLPRVWERFFKTDKSRSGPGTGLGLAIVKHIAQAHGGSVLATSELGAGSTFTITLPRVTSSPKRNGGRTAAAVDIYVPD
jgi:two-component system phosphate regulon sensor histidine kinase PhoR